MPPSLKKKSTGLRQDGIKTKPKKNSAISDSEFDEMLQIDPHALDRHLSEQAAIYHRLSTEYVEAVSVLDEARTELKHKEAELDPQVREDLAAESDGRVTESMVANAIQTHSDRVRLQKKVARLKLDADKKSARKDAFHQRGYMLRDMVELHVTGWFTKESIGAASNKKDGYAGYRADRARRGAARKKRIARGK